MSYSDSNEITKISVIIPCRNEFDYIDLFLQSLLKQDFCHLKYEILIADGSSDDGTREVLDRLSVEHPEIVIIDNPEKIVSAGLNRAIKMASGDIIIRMDVHTEYDLDYVACCLNTLLKSGADNVGGPARTRAMSFIQKANALAYHSPFSVGGARFHNAEYEGWVDTVTYGCWRKDTLVHVGLFDEELVCNQDDELNLRLIRSGGKIWQSPSIRSWYYPRATLLSLFKQYRQYGYWKVRVIQKHKLPASIRHLVPGGFIALLLLLILFSLAFSWARLALAGLLGLYLCANLGASLITCRLPKNWRYLPAMPFVFFAYHFGYGWGFLRGVIDFMLLKKSGRNKFRKLTR